MDDAAAIRFSDLRKRYPDGTEALKGISFEVCVGEILALLGRNGSGKTTSVRIATGLSTPTDGTVTVLGADVVTRRSWVQRRIGVTLQEAALDEVLTGREFLVLVGRLWGMRRLQARARADELLALFALSTSGDRQVRTYSGGMRRRLDIAASLVRLPRVLFLDEPTTGLDPQSRRALWAEIGRLREAHEMTVLLTTQYLEEAEALADRVAVIDRGRIVACGSTTELMRTHGSTWLTASLSPSDRAAALARLDGRAAVRDGALVVEISDGADALAVVSRLVDSGVEVEDVEIRRDSLEDVFLSLTEA